MKSLLAFIFLFSTSIAIAQTPDPLEVDKIIRHIANPLLEGKIETVLTRTVFPFKVGNKKISKEDLKKNFDKIFVKSIKEELQQKKGYESMDNEGTNYMFVCLSAPEGYEAAVPVFKKIDGIWMLTGVQLY